MVIKVVINRDVIKINYVGLKCGVCGVDFAENDDVVVCPDCGTPMHRACYKENCGCPNSEKHSDGYVFDGFEKITKSAQGVDLEKENNTRSYYICPICGEKNKKSASFCNNCGARLMTASQNENEQLNSQTVQQFPFIQGIDPLGGVSPDAEFEEGVKASDLACYVSVNTPYYINAFARIKNKSNRFNFAAALFSGVWFLYRKQYKVGGIVVSISVLLAVLQTFLTVKYSTPIMESLIATIGLSSSNVATMTMEQYYQLAFAIQSLPWQQQFFIAIPTIGAVIQIMFMVLFGIYGNKLYYRHCIEKVRILKSRSKEENFTPQETARVLNLAGGVNIIVAGVFAILYFMRLFI